MFKTALSALALCVMSTASYAQVDAPAFPEYNSETHCQNLTSKLHNERVTAESIYEDCVDTENSAKTTSTDIWASAPSQITTYCGALVDETSAVINQPGSYAVLQGCLSSEMAAYTQISEKWAGLSEVAAPICLAMLEDKEIISYNMLKLCLEE